MSSQVSKGRLIPAAILAIFVYGFIAAMLGTILPKLNMTPEQSGYIAMAQAIGLAVASIAVGPLIDNKGKKTGLLLGLALIAISLAALPQAVGNYQLVMALVVMWGFGGGVIVTAANALVSDISEERRATTLNLLNLFFGLGGLVTPLISANLVGGLAICYLGAGLAAFTLFVHAGTAMPAPTGERGFKLSEVGELLGRPSLYLLSFFLFLYVACEVGVWNWLPKHLIAQGVSETRALQILSLGFALGLLLGRVVVSRILINVKAPTVTLFAAVLMALTTYSMLQTGDATMAAVLVFCAGLSMAPVFPTTLAMVGDAFPKATATAMGIVITSGWVGLIVSSFIIGAIAGGEDTRLKTALLVIPAASVIMILVNLALRPMLARKAAVVTR